jgi:predicted nucleotidyltransferase
MRLSHQQVDIIKNKIASILGPAKKIILFGSRVNDQEKGGDIDLYIETDHVQENRASIASRIAASIQISLGDQKVDILLVDPNTILKPVHIKAQQEGIAL